MDDNIKKLMPWRPYYPNDFAGVTRGWPIVARGVFHELLDAAWTQGALPDDAHQLRAIARCTPLEWRSAWPYVEPHFPVGDDNQRHNLALEESRKKQIGLHRKRSAGGALGNLIRWHGAKRGDPDDAK